MNKPKEKNIIAKCGADAILPMVLVYMFYVILHGHLSPGGGFQGGVLAVAAIVLIFLGHGYKTTTQVLNFGFLRGLEGVACIAYICIAMVGIVFGANFCTNVLYLNGNIGDLISSGTISLMDEAVGLNVLTGVAVLSLSMLGLFLATNEKD